MTSPRTLVQKTPGADLLRDDRLCRRTADGDGSRRAHRCLLMVRGAMSDFLSARITCLGNAQARSSCVSPTADQRSRLPNYKAADTTRAMRRPNQQVKPLHDFVAVLRLLAIHA